MTNREFFTRLTDEVFGNTNAEELIKSEKYLEFENDVQEEITKYFTEMGCDTSNGRPTWLGFQLWFDANTDDETKEKFERKYKKI